MQRRSVPPRLKVATMIVILGDPAMAITGRGSRI
jgi:hypothetical protein